MQKKRRHGVIMWTKGHSCSFSLLLMTELFSTESASRTGLKLSHVILGLIGKWLTPSWKIWQNIYDIHQELEALFKSFFWGGGGGAWLQFDVLTNLVHLEVGECLNPALLWSRFSFYRPTHVIKAWLNQNNESFIVPQFSGNYPSVMDAECWSWVQLISNKLVIWYHRFFFPPFLPGTLFKWPLPRLFQFSSFLLMFLLHISHGQLWPARGHSLYKGVVNHFWCAPPKSFQAHNVKLGYSNKNYATEAKVWLLIVFLFGLNYMF